MPQMHVRVPVHFWGQAVIEFKCVPLALCVKRNVELLWLDYQFFLCGATVVN